MRMRLSLVVKAAALVLLPVALPPIPASATSAPTPQADAAAALAREIHPIELAVATGVEGIDRFLVAAMLKQPEIAEMEKQHPGIVKAMYAAARPFMVEGERHNAVKVQEALAELYRSQFSVEEQRQLLAFYSSASGRKIVRGMFNVEALSNTMDAIASDPQSGITSETAIVTQAQALGHLAAVLTPEDEKAAADFMATAAGKKLNGLTGKVRALVLGIVNAENPQLQAKVNAAMGAVYEQYTKKGDAGLK